MPRLPFAGPSSGASSTTSAGILTASRFRTIAYWTSTADQVRFQWKDYRHRGTAESDDAYLPRSSSDGSYSTLYLTGSSAFAITGCSAIGTGNRPRPDAATCMGMAPPVEAPLPEDYRDQHELPTGTSCASVLSATSGRMVIA